MPNLALTIFTIAPVFVQGLALSLGLIVAIGAQNAFVLQQGLRREHVGSGGCQLRKPALVWRGGILCAMVGAMVCQTQGMASAGWPDWIDHVGAGNLVGQACAAGVMWTRSGDCTPPQPAFFLTLNGPVM
jgi:hypothetical protein